MRKGQDGEKMVGKENNGENSCPLTLLPDDRQMVTDYNTDSSYQKWNYDCLTATDCNADRLGSDFSLVYEVIK